MSLHLSYIKSRLGDTAGWRQTVVDKYPNDTRNCIAIELLQSLAKSPSVSVEPAVIARLEQYRGWEFCQSVFEACREVGFRCMPLTLQDFVQHVISKLADAPTTLAKVLPAAKMGVV